MNPKPQSRALISRAEHEEAMIRSTSMVGRWTILLLLLVVATAAVSGARIPPINNSSSVSNGATLDPSPAPLPLTPKGEETPPAESKDTKEPVSKETPPVTIETPPVTNDNDTKTNDKVEPQQKVKPDNGTTTVNHGTEEKDNSHCCGNELRACLSSSGDGSNGGLSLEVTGHKVYQVTITPPSFLRAEPAQFTTENGKPVMVQIEIEDPEAAKKQDGSAKIIIKSEEGECEVLVPSLSRSNLLHGFTYSSMRTPVVGLVMLVVAIVIVVGGVVYCHYTRDRKSTYRQLELTDIHDQVIPTSRGDVTININGSTSSQGEDNNWDAGWDDDWEDTRADRSSSPAAVNNNTNGFTPAKKKAGWED